MPIALRRNIFALEYLGKGPIIPKIVDADGDAPHHRAVVFVTPQTKKGTSRSGQEYDDPLLCLKGEAYAQLSIEALYAEVLRAIRPRRPEPKTGNQ